MQDWCRWTSSGRTAFSYSYRRWNVFVSLEHKPLSIGRAVFSALRVLALLDRNYLAAGIVLLLGLVPIPTNAVSGTADPSQPYKLKLTAQYENAQSTIYFVDDPLLGASCYGSLALSTSTIF